MDRKRAYTQLNSNSKKIFAIRRRKCKSPFLSQNEGTQSKKGNTKLKRDNRREKYENQVCNENEMEAKMGNITTRNKIKELVYKLASLKKKPGEAFCTE